MFWILFLSRVVALTAHEHEFSGAPAKTSDGPKFVFPDEGDIYFGGNVAALKASLSHALDQDCLNSWPRNESLEIAIVFRHDGYVPETSHYYIQYQMEQVASTQTTDIGAGFRNFADNTQYKMKLDAALQIWEWSPRHIAFLQREQPGTISQKIKHVPLWSSVNVDSGPMCDDILALPTCKNIPGADVLFFGHLTKSRQSLCAQVDAEMTRMYSNGHLFSHECLSGVFGSSLQCKVCKAKVVYSDHSRNDSVLEVHRINPLLALGKAVISATSADTLLDSEYSGALDLVLPRDIPGAVSRLLLDDQARTKVEWNAYAFAKKQKARAQPALCRALNALATTVERHAFPQWSAGPESRVPYLALRRLGANGTNGTNGTNASTTSSAVTTTATDATSLAGGTTTFSADGSTTPASTTPSTTSTVLLGGQCIGNDSRCRGSTQSLCAHLKQQGSHCFWQASNAGRGQQGNCFGNDSRCSSSGQAKCARLSAHGSDCTWQKTDGSPGTCLGNDSRCGSSDRSHCGYLASQGTHCKWRAAFSITGSLVASVSNAAAFVSSGSAKSAVAQSIANITSVPIQYVDVDLSFVLAKRRLAYTGTRYPQSGRVLMAYGIDVPGDAPITLIATGSEVGALLASSGTGEMTQVISTELEETIGSHVFNIFVTSVSSPTVAVDGETATAFASSSTLVATTSTTLSTTLSTMPVHLSAGMTSSSPGTSSTSTAQPVRNDESRADEWHAVSPMCWAMILVALTRG